MHDILNNLHQLPAIPAVVQELIHSFDDPGLDSQHLARKIGQDQALAARVLRVANSSFYGLPRQVGSIQDAVVVLGFSTVRSLVLSAGIIGAFSAAEAGGVDRKQYWRRGLITAIYARAVAHCLRQDGEMAFSAGLLHDIGIMVLDVCDHPRFAALWQDAHGGESGLIEAERAALGFDHAELGAEVARRWKFPPAIEAAIRHHYQPEHRPFETLTGIVRIAALLERLGEENAPADEWFARIPQTLRDELKLEREQLEKCLPRLEQVEAAQSQMLA